MNSGREVWRQLAAVVEAQRGVGLMPDEMKWLQRNLAYERQHNADCLGMCAELERQLEVARRMQRQATEAHECWHQKCIAWETRAGLLEVPIGQVVQG